LTATPNAAASSYCGRMQTVSGPQIVVPDSGLLGQAVRKFMGGEGGSAYAGAPGSLAFVACVGDEVVGWCWGYHLIRPDDSSMVYVHQLKVDSAYRRQGIGRALVEAFMGAGVAAGASKMFLTTGADNSAARSLYDSLGGGLAAQGPTVNYWFLL
jgi:ribosomal protein S18 acetylase RimI-like enzyme